MNYYINTEKIGLDELRKRIEETDLVPSRSSLIDGINENFSKLKKSGYITFADLRKDLKNSKNISKISEKTEISIEYLTLLRREIESYFPKPFPLKGFEWISEKEITELVRAGYKNTVLFYEAFSSLKERKALAKELDIDLSIIEELYTLISLTRIQWTSPVAARMFIAAGYKDVKSILTADAEKMCEEIDRVNKKNEYFKGKIGLRDIKRLINAASYV